MDGLLLAVALAILLVGGAGLSALLWPRAGMVEGLGLTFLLGAATVSMASFCAGLLLPAAALRPAVTAVCLTLGLAGWRRRRRLGVRWRFEGMEWLWCAACAGAVGFISKKTALGPLEWDGLLVFEMKARFAFLNGGVLPTAYFLDASRAWSHPTYPLLLPLSESWLYLWLGRADQQWVKVLFPMFFAALLAMLYAASRRIGSRGPVSLVLLMCVSLVWRGGGSVGSAYADIPLAAYYLAAIVYLLDYGRTMHARALLLSGVLMACACWLKREGALLWVFVALLGGFEPAKRLLREVGRGAWRRVGVETLGLAGLLAPGLLVMLLWRLFLQRMNLGYDHDFLPISLAALKANAPFMPPVLQFLAGEMLHSRQGLLFWPAAIGAAVYSIVTRRQVLLPAAVLGPVLAYAGVYWLSAWADRVLHAESSYPRLLLHIAPVAAVLLGSLLDRENSAKELAADASGMT
jgi:hypothetical protein